ncbi:hypothetical protein GMORB2_5928 [Geosmithia morbida]|uniref:DRBM domain-containing protein n=1 Tax=Geosmithia morbida TaxID=1094350 RepID=A0A9P4YXA1_9HYPO|nr:uncharacterized protein GMORB2_5928 [Geosmithia morbida]KAF4124212.1 hypothetical protein GMORB2_5928 [Geosmithia morbida]
MATTAPSSFSPAAPWDRLRAWIDEKENWERTHGAPAPLVQRELVAVSNLVPFMQEPQVGDEDHVSNLMRFIQLKHLAHPTFIDEGPIDVKINGLTEKRWRCFCSLDPDKEHFPREGHGYSVGEDIPSFKSKKSAKQFAAKIALENGLNMCGSGVEERELYHRVSHLATRLGFGTPQYHVEPDIGGIPNFYRGWVQFEPLPDRLGNVERVLGRTETKVQIAERTLSILEGRLRRKHEIIDDMLK